MEEERKGFAYYVSKEQIDDYRKWSAKRKLEWLFLANKMRKELPEKTRKIQDDFRKGII